MRLVAWNCNMALHRKLDALMALRPDIAVISECAAPARLSEKLDMTRLNSEPVWIGANKDKGLAVFAFNGYRARLNDDYRPTLRHIAPVRVTGPVSFNLLAVWAQNFSAGIRRKRQPGPFRLALRHYRDFLSAAPAVAAGDFNNNCYWDKPGYLINHSYAVAALDRFGLVSAYHAARGEAQGAEAEPTHYWRDRRKDGPTYHIDYIFLPHDWIGGLRELRVGDFENWCGNGLSDHVPVVAEIQVSTTLPTQL